jgi:hypothetical protein
MVQTQMTNQYPVCIYLCLQNRSIQNQENTCLKDIAKLSKFGEFLCTQKVAPKIAYLAHCAVRPEAFLFVEVRMLSDEGSVQLIVVMRSAGYP